MKLRDSEGKVTIGAAACGSWLPRAVTVLILAFSLLLASATEDGVWAHSVGGINCEDLGGPFGVPGVLEPPDQVGEWGPSEAWPGIATHATLLHTGQVLWYRGGSTTYLWDPVLNTHQEILAPVAGLLCSGHSTLDDGRVIVIGGPDGSPPGVFSTLIFDPATDTWTQKADMACDRWYPTSTTLPDGRVLAMGGAGGVVPFCSTPEIYDVVTDTWTELHALDKNVVVYPYLFVQENGKVFYGGPYYGSGDSSTSVSQLIDLVAQVWEEVDEPSFHSRDGSSAMYRPGKVIHAGGQNPALDKAEVIDLNDSVPKWRLVDSLEYARRRFVLTLLPDGTTLAVGGALSGQSTPECAVHAAELWDPDTELWTTMASQERPHMYHSVALLLPDGRVLAAGGENSHVGGEFTAEIYSPPYLFKGPRPTITSGPSSVVYGETFSITTPDSASIDSVAFMRPASITHNFDQNQRYVPGNFVDQGTYLDVTAPANANLAPPGYYMVFLVDTTGVPSVAHFLHVGEPPCNQAIDTDNDTVPDCDDNCPSVANGPAEAGISGVGNQTDTDADTRGNACDDDDDSDGLLDIYETNTGTYVSSTDTGTDPLIFDSDSDGLSDGVEVTTTSTDPVDPDSDGDTLNDGDEINIYGTDPLNPDSDNDGYTDGAEVAAGTNPNDPASHPGILVPTMGPWALGLLAALFIAASRHLLAARRSRPT